MGESCLIDPLPIRNDHPRGIGLKVACTVKERNSVGRDIIRFNLHKLQDVRIVTVTISLC